MKKLIALLAALTMLFVCGCGSNSKDNGTDNGNGTNNGTNNAVDERHDTNTNTVGDDVREGVDDAGNAVETRWMSRQRHPRRRRCRDRRKQ